MGTWSVSIPASTQNLGQNLAHSSCSVNTKEEKRKGEREKGKAEEKGKEGKKERKSLCGCPILRLKPLMVKAEAKHLQIPRTLWIIHSNEFQLQLCSSERRQWKRQLNYYDF